MKPKFDETDAEWVARGGHRLRVEQQMREPDDLPNLNDSTQAWTPEHDFWREFLQLAINDALGRSPGAEKVCQHCHLEAHPTTCFNVNGHYKTARKGECGFSKTIQQCGQDWFGTKHAEETCAMLGIDITYLTRWLEGRKANAQTPSDTGLPSEAGDAPSAPGMVREVHSGEET